jgi:hypothetical protein
VELTVRHFLAQLAAGDPLAVAIVVLAVVLILITVYAVRLGARTRRLEQQVRRRRVGYVHKIRVVHPPTVRPFNAAEHFDPWAPSPHEPNGRIN